MTIPQLVKKPHWAQDALLCGLSIAEFTSPLFISEYITYPLKSYHQKQDWSFKTLLIKKKKSYLGGTWNTGFLCLVTSQQKHRITKLIVSNYFESRKVDIQFLWLYMDFEDWQPENTLSSLSWRVNLYLTYQTKQQGIFPW